MAQRAFISIRMSPPTPPTSRIHPAAHVAPDALIGPGCRVGPGAVVPPGCMLAGDVSVGPNVVFVEPDVANGQRPARVDAGVRIGANAVVHPDIVLATGVVVRAGSVVTRSVPHHAVVDGNPATIVGYVDTPHSHEAPAPRIAAAFDGPVQSTPVDGVTLHRMKVVPDLRGSLSVGEFERDIPFRPLRYFLVFGVPSRETRGEHAHRCCHQFLVCVRGSCAVVADDGQRRVEVVLDSLDTGLYLPPMVWGIQYKYSPDSVLLVFASHHYDPADYIRDYDEFLHAKERA
ncbi:MAG: WxcM-like domain-containing protein [Rhodoferax sp.]|jgi:acetyltransferase-like isoleucine patch superfamily enzyme/dTDP-4-dehydrorhamnose 3,5-epimerase-like enzyme|nr:WxcM-like domain-containing protein [Rhodoferax sp.]